jgi:hypothetical protein
MATSTDVLAEGSTNLYHTTGRARAAISASSATGVSYNSTTGTISLGSIPNSSLANNSITINGTSVALGGTRTLDTDAVSEGSTNKYFSNTLARGAVSVTDSGGDGSLSYNSTTGVITYTGPSASEVRAHFSAGTGITITSGAIATTITQYTDALARGAVSFTAGSGAYNSTTGVFTIPTNTNQLTNGAGYITGYTETDTLASVTGRGATTTAALSTGALTVTGAITATGEVTAYFSDLRLKTNIVPIADALAKVEAINGVTFDPNEAALALGIDARHQIGVIAQEVEAVAPELVCDSAFAGYKTVRYDKLTALLIEAVKELSAKVTTLEAQLGNAKPTL